MHISAIELASAFAVVGFLASIYVIEAFLLLRAFVIKLMNRRVPSGLRTKPALTVHALAVIIIIFGLYGYFIEPYWLDVREVTLKTGKLKNITLTIAQISDLHCDTRLRNELKLASIINSFRPDLVVFTGDAVNTLKAVPVFENTLGAMEAGIGKFAVRGNFDTVYYGNVDLFSGTGFEDLDKKAVRLTKGGEEFYISGLDYIYHNTLWPGVLGQVPPDRYSIFLYHTPSLIESIAPSYNVDLYLSGHTHGGQVAVPFYGAILTFSKYGKKYEAGLYKVGPVALYVNRGIGMEGGFVPRIRFFSRPEITIFHIIPETGASRTDPAV